jgi:hypothetical protein
MWKSTAFYKWVNTQHPVCQHCPIPSPPRLSMLTYSNRTRKRTSGSLWSICAASHIPSKRNTLRKKVLVLPLARPWPAASKLQMPQSPKQGKIGYHHRQLLPSPLRNPHRTVHSPQSWLILSMQRRTYQQNRHYRPFSRGWKLYTVPQKISARGACHTRQLCPNYTSSIPSLPTKITALAHINKASKMSCITTPRRSSQLWIPSIKHLIYTVSFA